MVTCNICMNYYLACFYPIFKLQNVMYETQTIENWSRVLIDEGTRTVIQKSSGILTGVPFVHKTACLLSKQFLGLLPKSLYHNLLQIIALCKFWGFLQWLTYKSKLCAGCLSNTCCVAFSWFSALWVNLLKASACCIAMPNPTYPPNSALNECHVMGGVWTSAYSRVLTPCTSHNFGLL